MANNFKCNCGKEYAISSYRMVMGNSGSQYKNKQGQILKCDGCGKNLIEIQKDFGVPMIGTFSGMSSEQKKEVLKKRSSIHFNRELKDRQEQMHKDTFNQLIGK